MAGISLARIESLNERPIMAGGSYVLYWMHSARRTGCNCGLQRAAHWSRKLGRPLVVLEPLRVDYPFASRRFHAFILQGMEANREAFANTPVWYYPYVEPRPGTAKGLLAALAGQACLVVTDIFPCFFIPNMNRAAGEQVPVLLEAVDSCGLLPLAQPGREFSRAYDFRRYLQRNLGPHLLDLPARDPLSALDRKGRARLTGEILRRWPPASRALLRAEPAQLSKLPIDQEVEETTASSGQEEARRCLGEFLEDGLYRYHTEARHPASGAVSGLSPYLHFGHISAQEIFLALADQEKWAPHQIPEQGRGGREGWLGMGPAAEAWLDQLITWRELGYIFCRHRPDYDRFSSLPGWASKTLGQHAQDSRPYLYTPEPLETAQTHDPRWNAAQNQLVREGRMHNYLRMAWGKKILHWTRDPRQALKVMVGLNNRYALDGRDPNSYSGIFWVLGRFDRAWGPERPVFGKVRYMSLANTRRKLKLGDYLERHGPGPRDQGQG